MVIESETGVAAASEPSGERFIPEAMGDSLIEAEHQVRYRLAAIAAGDRRVLDAGCGVGWGSLLLHQAGAAKVTGLDLSDEALADARRRAPDVRFVRGDLQRLPFGRATFDLVTCFEAIEHVPDPYRVLDELLRVMDPGGLLMVSSPNPDVYPPGNPFHVHEFKPSDLLAEVAKRFAHAVLWLQHGHIGASLRREGERGPVPADVLAPASSEGAVYSLVVASDAELPVLAGRANLVSSHQIDHLAATAEALAADRASIQVTWEQVAAERASYLAEHAAALADAARLSSEVAELRERVRIADRDRERAAADRDRALLLLLESEQELARRVQSLRHGDV